jgi:hypothetical protein
LIEVRILTPEQHNKYLGISHLVYGGLFGVFMFFMVGFLIAMQRMTELDSRGGPPPFFFGLMGVMFSVIYGAMMIPSLIAGYALLKRKSWAKTAAIIGGVLAAMSFPIGTAVCVYTFWFLFSDPGKFLYDRPSYALPPGRQAWTASNVNEQREHQYLPPQGPPDWR